MMVELVLVDAKTDEIFTTVELEQELFDALVKIAEKDKKTLEQIVSEAILEEIEKEKKKSKKK
jgi:predicted transcriptional regulator